MSELRIISAAPLRPRSGLLSWLKAALSSRAEDEAIRRSRQRLAEYDDRLLGDIGLTRKEAFGREARPDWATPDPWATTRAR